MLRFSLIIILVCAPAVGTARAQDYAIVDLRGYRGTGDSGASWLSDDGEFVVGTASEPGKAAWWNNGNWHPIGDLGGLTSHARHANAAGEIVGRSAISMSVSNHAFYWSVASGMIDLGTLGGEQSEAESINELGVVVGFSDPTQGSVAGFTWTESEGMQQLPYLPGGDRTWAFDVDDAGAVVGASSDGDGHIWPVMWQDNIMINLGSFGCSGLCRGEAQAINSSGQIAGWTLLGTSEHAFRAQDGVLWDLHDSTIASRSWGCGINNFGDVVGFMTNYRDEIEAFIWTETDGMRRVTDLLPPKSKWVLRFGPDSINDLGQIALTGVPDPDRGGLFHGAIVTPVLPSFTLDPPDPPTAGELVTLRAFGAAPHATIYFLYSGNGGGRRIPGCDLMDGTLQLNKPTGVGSAVADTTGMAELTVFVDPEASGREFLIQAADPQRCQISNYQFVQFK